jgi:tellurite resistance protein TehA-like permease
MANRRFFRRPPVHPMNPMLRESLPVTASEPDVKRGITGLFWRTVEGFPLAYFALIMATGIVSIAANLFGFSFIAVPLLWLNAAMYLALWGITLLRLVRFPRRFWANLTDHSQATGVFTIVAGTGVLGSQAVLIANMPGIGLFLWWVTLILGLALTYLVFSALIVQETKPAIEKGLNGGWLLTVVATQSVSVLGGLVSAFAGDFQKPLLFIALVAWLFGGMLYLWIISLIFYRYMFYPFLPEDLSPPYWISMGAVAISTLAGAGLIAQESHSAFLTSLHPFLVCFTLLFWATATWWIPILVILGIWRHVYKRFPLTYHPSYWGLVFPLGMYTVCTMRLVEVTGLQLLLAIPQVFLFLALIAWAATFLGMLRRITLGIQREMGTS